MHLIVKLIFITPSTLHQTINFMRSKVKGKKRDKFKRMVYVPSVTQRGNPLLCFGAFPHLHPLPLLPHPQANQDGPWKYPSLPQRGHKCIPYHTYFRWWWWSLRSMENESECHQLYDPKRVLEIPQLVTKWLPISWLQYWAHHCRSYSIWIPPFKLMKRAELCEERHIPARNAFLSSLCQRRWPSWIPHFEQEPGLWASKLSRTCKMMGSVL